VASETIAVIPTESRLRLEGQLVSAATPALLPELLPEPTLFPATGAALQSDFLSQSRLEEHHRP